MVKRKSHGIRIASRNYRLRVCVLCSCSFKPNNPRSKRCHDCMVIRCAVCEKDISTSGGTLERQRKGKRRLCMNCYQEYPFERTRNGNTVASIGSRRIDKIGYVRIKCENGVWRFEHRVVMENKLGRPLRPKEIVHHKDKNRSNNHPDNLEVCVNLRDHLDTYHSDSLKPPPVHHNGRKKKDEPGYIPIS